MNYNRLLAFGAVAGVGLIITGGVLYWRQKKMLTALPSGVSGRLGSTAQEAPVIGSYSDGNMRTELRASANMSIEQRLATIQRKVRESIQDPEMRKLALSITAKCPERDKRCEAKAIYKAVKKRVRYSGDAAEVIWADGSVEGVDLYQSARRTWQFKAGDCDDQAILNSTLLTLNGITSRLRVTSEVKGHEASHIYSGALLPDFVALDTTLPGSFKFGYEAPYAEARDFVA